MTDRVTHITQFDIALTELDELDRRKSPSKRAILHDLEKSTSGRLDRVIGQNAEIGAAICHNNWHRSQKV